MQPDRAFLDIQPAIEVLARMQKMGQTRLDVLRQAVAMAGFDCERKVIQACTQAVYARPQYGHYKRTGSLRRSIWAAHPDTVRGMEQQLALPLGGPGGGADIVKMTTTGMETTVGSWIRYARFVNDGTFFMNPTYFFERGMVDAQQTLEQYTLRALDEILRSL